jgi:hypothetical protein
MKSARRLLALHELSVQCPLPGVKRSCTKMGGSFGLTLSGPDESTVGFISAGTENVKATLCNIDHRGCDTARSLPSREPNGSTMEARQRYSAG